MGRINVTSVFLRGESPNEKYASINIRLGERRSLGTLSWYMTHAGDLNMEREHEGDD